MLISETQAYGKYIQPVDSSTHIKSKINNAEKNVVMQAKTDNEVFNKVLDQHLINNVPDSNKNVTNMEITNLYNILDSNNSVKMNLLANKYAHLLIDDSHDVNANSKRDVVNFVLNSKTNMNHENMLLMKSLIETHYSAYTNHNQITDHHLGYCDPHDYTVIYAVLSGIRRKNLGL